MFCGAERRSSGKNKSLKALYLLIFAHMVCPVVMKNWLFMGSETAGQSNAIWFTLIESCRRRRVDPWKYLVWIFEELPKIKVSKSTFASYTPKAYAKSLSKPSFQKTA
jgi:hypothetical protein